MGQVVVVELCEVKEIKRRRLTIQFVMKGEDHWWGFVDEIPKELVPMDNSVRALYLSFPSHFISSSSINISLSSSSWVCFFFLGVLVINRHCCCLSSLRLSPSTPRRPPDGCSSKTHTTLLVETYHQHRRLRALIEKLEKEGSCPMQILGDDGDWTKNDFWAAVKFLRHAFRSNEILKVELDLTMVKMNSSFFKLKPNSFCNTSVSFALSDLLRLEVSF
ncbi:uncharacterized protein LOC105793990 [Gossypium raimondii]|uniref:uncharacterized protein LOC105793990 n=1 Tax=Gossypium raimondii TaxID=29730 RepID=UPI00227B6574|nr:uncharacterized protein LOC105793990 [Gossypium raimondii]